MIHRIINIFFLFTLIFVFIIFAKSGDHIRISIAVMASVLFGLTAFLLNWLTMDGAFSASIFGVVAYGLGDWRAALLVLIFFVTASLLSSNTTDVEEKLSIKFRRDGTQVWANGFWFCLWVVLWFVSHQSIFMVAAAGSIAVANADTWATEIGNKIRGKTVLITSMNKVTPGTDGGISLFGTLGTIVGSSIIGVIFWLSTPDATYLILVLVIVAGIGGSLLDSFLGAKFQGKVYTMSRIKTDSSFTIKLDNNLVNWLSIGISSIVVLLITLIFQV